MTTRVVGSRADRIRNPRRRLGRCLLPLVVGVVIATATAAADVFEAGHPDMEWRIGQGVAAPWAAAASESSGPGLADRRVLFSAMSIAAPDPLACSEPRYEYVLSPAEGLFQGMLPPPAAQSARALGISDLPLLTLRVTCDGGVFDYHLVSPDKALLGLDNVVWPLLRQGGKATPEQVVLALLQSHLTHDMGFTPTTVASKHAYLSDDLRAAIEAYFRRPVPQDEAPRINGDPFTNSQEYPTRFVFGRASIEGRRAVMPIQFGDEAAAQVVEVLLRRSGREWRVDDLRYEEGSTLRGLLRPTP